MAVSRGRGRGASGKSAKPARRAAPRRAGRGLSTTEYGLAPTSRNYAYPRGTGTDRGKRPSYPIDPRHVKAALSYASRKGTAGTSATVRGAVAKRYGSVEAGLAAARRAGK